MISGGVGDYLAHNLIHSSSEYCIEKFASKKDKMPKGVRQSSS
jgi:hypothetical protein